MKKIKLYSILFLILGLVLLSSSYFIFGSFSDGFRAGTLIKFSRKGIFFKSYEGELNQGMVISEQSSTGNVWKFTVDGNNKKLVQDIEEALLSREKGENSLL